jgi:hypothetical protein
MASYWLLSYCTPDTTQKPHFRIAGTLTKSMYAYHHQQHHCTTIPFANKGADKGRQSPIINKMTSISYSENSVFDTKR